MPVLGASKKIQAYDQIRRRPGEVIGDHIVREKRAFHEMTGGLSEVSETPVTRKLEHDAAVTKLPLEIPVYSDAEYEMLEDENTFTEAPWQQEQIGQTFFELGNSGRPSSPKCTSLTSRATVLAGTRNDTEHTAIVTQLRSPWDDQDVRDRDR